MIVSLLKRNTRKVLARSGAIDLMWKQLGSGLYVFNYHRVGDPNATEFDPNVFSCDGSHFRAQVELIRSRFRVVTIKETLEELDAGRSSAALALITFDDGYRDNFTTAFPILRELGVPATFFVPTDFIGTRKIQWWDEIAWLVRHTNATEIATSFTPQPIPVRRSEIGMTIRRVLTAFKRAPTSGEEKLNELRRVLGCTMPENAAEQLFMTWDELREMRAAGMDIGSHSHTHRILSHLSLDEQTDELRGSKAILERELGEPIHSIAYPVGARDSFTNDTERLTREAGYRVGFSFIGGVNRAQPPRFALRRIAVEENASPEALKITTLRATETAQRLTSVVDSLRGRRPMPVH